MGVHVWDFDLYIKNKKKQLTGDMICFTFLKTTLYTMDSGLEEGKSGYVELVVIVQM